MQRSRLQLFVFTSFISFHSFRLLVVHKDDLSENHTVIKIDLQSVEYQLNQILHSGFHSRAFFRYCDYSRYKLAVASLCILYMFVWHQFDVWSPASLLERAAFSHGRLWCPAQERAVRSSDWPHPCPPLPAGRCSHLLLHGPGEMCIEMCTTHILALYEPDETSKNCFTLKNLFTVLAFPTRYVGPKNYLKDT